MTTFKIDFVENPALVSGICLCIDAKQEKFLRITHVFPTCVYVMAVSNVEAVRESAYPRRMNLNELHDIEKSTGSRWCRLQLPEILAFRPPEGSAQEEEIENNWNLIKPLVERLESERNWTKTSLTSLVSTRSQEVNVAHMTVKRTLLRFFYFGMTKLSLRAMPRGAKPMSSRLQLTIDSKEAPQKAKIRTGRPSRASEVLGKPTLVLDERDDARMAQMLKRELKEFSSKKAIFQKYRDEYFRKDHPEEWEAWKAGRTAAPVTLRMFSYRTRNVLLTEAQQANLTFLKKRHEGNGELRANGPGEIWELDGTGGRIHLVSAEQGPNGERRLLGKPNIYIFIDRWSRFVTGIYITFAANSYEQLCHAFEYALTDREIRFARIGLDVSEQRWPRAQLPAEITTDRGPEFIGSQIVKNVVDLLRIDHTPLAAYDPDAKAIVERFIRTLKLRMYQAQDGTYAKAIKNRENKIAAKNAKTAAVETLEDAYRALIDIVMDHNNRPHRRLKQLGVLTQHSIEPTPQAAYLWGIRNISGLRSSHFSDSEIAKILMSTHNATISRGVIRFKGHVYQPVDALAIEIAMASNTTPHSVQIKTDSELIDIYAAVGSHRYAHFRANSATLDAFGRMAHDEATLRKPHTALRDALAENNYQRHIAQKAIEQKAAKRPLHSSGSPLMELSVEERRAERRKEDLAIKRKLAGFKETDLHDPLTAEKNSKENSDKGVESWQDRKSERESRLLKLAKKTT